VWKPTTWITLKRALETKVRAAMKMWNPTRGKTWPDNDTSEEDETKSMEWKPTSVAR
jgi:hypothetical protein